TRRSSDLYIKGMGSNERWESLHMFKQFHQNLSYYYINEESSHEVFEIYYGKDPDKRKIELAQPLRELDPEIIATQVATKSVLCDNHLRSETFLYQKDNIERKLDHAIDGMNQSGRKIFDGS